MFESRRILSYLACGLLVVSLVACGGDPKSPVDPGPLPTPPPPPPPPVVVSQGTGLALEAQFIGRIVFSTTQPGSLEATVDWTFEENDVDLGIVSGDCSFDAFMTGQCPIVGIGASITDKPEKARGTGAAGTYTLFIENAGPGDETLSYQVVLTPDATATSSSTGEKLHWQLKVPPRGFVDVP